MQKERCFESCLKENEERRHFKPRPLPLGRAPEGFYPGSDYNDLESSTQVVSQQKQQRQAWKTLNQVQGDDLVCYNNNAFTLIELLVVVLIIGILAAVAVPQYQKAVEKSRGVQALTLLKSMGQALQSYYMANSSYPTDFDELDIDIPAGWTGSERWYVTDGVITTKSNGEWSLQLVRNSAGALQLYMGRLTGKYQGAAFLHTIVSGAGTLSSLPFRCIERKESGVIFTQPDGAYCHDIWKGTLIVDDATSMRVYKLP